MGSTWTWAAFQSVVIRCETCSDSRQHMVLYLSLERHTLHPRASASATNEAEQGLGKNQECAESSLFILSVYLQLRTPCCYHPPNNLYITGLTCSKKLQPSILLYTNFTEHIVPTVTCGMTKTNWIYFIMCTTLWSVCLGAQIHTVI